MPKGFYKRTEWHKSQMKNTFKKGHKPWNKGKKYPQISGEKHYKWKGGEYKTHERIFLFKPKHPFCDKRGYIRKSRFVMEKHLGRYLKPTEKIHHLNGISDDDRIKNLKLFLNHNEHMKYHNYPRNKKGQFIKLQ